MPHSANAHAPCFEKASGYRYLMPDTFYSWIPVLATLQAIDNRA